jgi:peptide/nickel transport system permease protein
MMRMFAVGFLGCISLAALGADVLSPHDYTMQFRQHADEAPSRTFLLGTDELGRDRLSRLLHGMRVSLLCAPAAALLATAIGAGFGVAAGYFGGWVDEAATSLTDLFLSLPWLFVLLSLRAMLPLNVSPYISIAAIFGLIALVGWASGARVVRASVIRMRSAGAMLHATAYGCSGWRLLSVHVAADLKPVLSAQFWIFVPVCLLAEANLGMLGLGVAEPMPSWGNLLAELQNYQRILEMPWILTPGILLVLVVASLHFVVSGNNTWE